MINNNLDCPVFNDNRNYDYSKQRISDIAEYPFLINLIEPNSKVIDLGCGSGSLL
jgi:hypothetical protein